MDPEAFEDALARGLAGSTRIAVLGIGDDLNPLDRPGIIGALLIHALERPNVTVFLTGTMPENYTGALKTLRPSHVVMLDAADLGAPPGTVALIHPEQVRGRRFSTHAMPLSLVIQYLEGESKMKVLLVGIQPDPQVPASSLEAGLSREVMEGLHRLRDAFSHSARRLW